MLFLRSDAQFVTNGSENVQQFFNLSTVLILTSLFLTVKFFITVYDIEGCDGMEHVSVELRELLSAIYRTIPVKKGMYLFQEGEKADELYYIQSGKIQISKTNMDGQELTLRICRRGFDRRTDALLSRRPLYADGESARRQRRFRYSARGD